MLFAVYLMASFKRKKKEDVDDDMACKDDLMMMLLHIYDLQGEMRT